MRRSERCARSCPRRQLPSAAAAEQARYSTVALAAPPLGGFLFGLSRSLPFLADAVSYVFSFFSLVAMRTPFEEEREPEQSVRLRSQLAEGFRWLWRQPFLRTCAVLFTWTNLVFEAMFLVLVVVGRRQGLSGTEIGALLAVLGACSLAGSVLAQRLPRMLSMRAIVVASFWVQLAVAAFVADPSVYVLLASIVPMTVFLPTVNAVVIGYRVAIVPDRLTGRVNSVARTIALCASPLGPLTAGLLLGSLSPRTTVASMRRCCSCWRCWRWRARRSGTLRASRSSRTFLRAELLAQQPVDDLRVRLALRLAHHPADEVAEHALLAAAVCRDLVRVRTRGRSRSPAPAPTRRR